MFRNALPDLFEMFDFADPSMVVGRRDASTVAPQALFLLNHPFVLEQARAIAARLLAEPSRAVTPAGSTRAYPRWSLGRPPRPPEARAGHLDFLGCNRRPAVGGGRWALLVQALFASIDFRYVD